MFKNMLKNMLDSMARKYKLYNFDFILLAMAIGLSIFGFIATGMTDKSDIKKQITGMVFCFVVF